MSESTFKFKLSIIITTNCRCRPGQWVTGAIALTHQAMYDFYKQ